MYIDNIYTLYTVGGERLDIVISNSSQVPLYEQIESQIKNQIINLTLKPGEALPSIRTLAKELKVSILLLKDHMKNLKKKDLLKLL